MGNGKKNDNAGDLNDLADSLEDQFSEEIIAVEAIESEKESTWQPIKGSPETVEMVRDFLVEAPQETGFQLAEKHVAGLSTRIAAVWEKHMGEPPEWLKPYYEEVQLVTYVGFLGGSMWWGYRQAAAAAMEAAAEESNKEEHGTDQSESAPTE